jgi:S1-C subfamily serine protease
VPGYVAAVPLHLSRLCVPSLLLGASLIVTGCQSLTRPTPAKIDAAAAIGEADLAAHRTAIQSACFLVLSNDTEFTPEFTTANGAFRTRDATGGGRSGLATAITADGYLITAAHVVLKHNFVIGLVDGAFALKPARVVHRFTDSTFGSEFALLHLEGATLSPLPISPRNPTDPRVYALIYDRNTGHGLRLVAGTVVDTPTAASAEASVLISDLPLWHGDSGGPLLDADGHWIGLNTAYNMPWLTLKVAEISCLPDPTFIQRLLDQDRARPAILPFDAPL